jgi:RimJ/RimL family protein N-acetyltransferase
MTATIKTIMNEWAVPRMGVQHIRVTAFVVNYLEYFLVHSLTLWHRQGNTGSIRVFEKNGFTMTATLKDCIEMTARGRAGGPKRSIHVLDWKLDS